MADSGRWIMTGWLATVLRGLCLFQVLQRVVCGTNPRPPHVLFIVADDLGWDDVGFRSGQIDTPNIDSLAADGVVLDQYYVQSVCSPSRATFLTGRYPLHHTINDWIKPGHAEALPLNETLIPQVLQEAGYQAHASGKWHLGFTSWEHTPTFRGFQSFVGFYSGGEGYFDHESNGYDFRRDMRPLCGAGCSKLAKEDQGVYSTHAFTSYAVQVIQGHNTSLPLFLYLAYQAVHAPRQVPKEYSEAYRGRIHDPIRRDFAGMLSCMDEGIGNVTTALRAKGMLGHTLIVFTTDNGGPIFGGDFVGSRNFPLRGGKHSIWEGGTRATGLVWAGKDTGLLAESRRGTQSHQLMHAADWLPTLCEVAGIRAACARLPLDGVDQSGALFRGSEGLREEVLYGQHDNARNLAPPYDTALRDQRGWRLVWGWGGLPNWWSQPVNYTATAAPTQVPALDVSGNRTALQLFDLHSDPGEHHDVAAQHTAVVQRLAQRVQSLLREQVDVVGGGGHPDPSCPPYDKHQHMDPDLGAIWEPWCHLSSWEAQLTV